MTDHTCRECSRTFTDPAEHRTLCDACAEEIDRQDALFWDDVEFDLAWERGWREGDEWPDIDEDDLMSEGLSRLDMTNEERFAAGATWVYEDAS